MVRVPQVGQLRHPVLLHLHQRHTRHQRRVVVHLRPGAREVNHPCRCRAPTPVKHPVSEWSSDASGMDRPRILYVRPRYSESPCAVVPLPGMCFVFNTYGRLAFNRGQSRRGRAPTRRVHLTVRHKPVHQSIAAHIQCPVREDPSPKPQQIA